MKVESVEQFTRLVKEIEGRSGYRRPQAFGVGPATFAIGSLDEPGTVGDGATVLDTWFPAPNREENFGSAAILADLAGLNDLLFRRNSVTGTVEVVHKKNQVVLNDALHQN